MIEYSHEYQKQNLMYVTEDGSYGSADDVVIFDATELDGHWADVIEGGDVRESQRPDFIRWFIENQTHDQLEGEYVPCEICDRWQGGTEDEIQEELEEEGN